MTLSPSSYFSHVMRSGRPTDQHQAEINQTTLITTENRKQRLRNFSLRDKAQQQKLRIISDKTISPYRTDQWGMIISRKSIHCQITTPSHNPQIKIRSFQAPLWEKRKEKKKTFFSRRNILHILNQWSWDPTSDASNGLTTPNQKMITRRKLYLPVAKPLLKTEILRWEAALEAHIILEAMTASSLPLPLPVSLSLSLFVEQAVWWVGSHSVDEAQSNI